MFWESRKALCKNQSIYHLVGTFTSHSWYRLSKNWLWYYWSFVLFRLQANKEAWSWAIGAWPWPGGGPGICWRVLGLEMLEDPGPVGCWWILNNMSWLTELANQFIWILSEVIWVISNMTTVICWRIFSVHFSFNAAFRDEHQQQNDFNPVSV